MFSMFLKVSLYVIILVYTNIRFMENITKEDLEQIMKLFPITSKWLNMLAEEERIHNEFMKKAQEIIGNSL